MYTLPRIFCHTKFVVTAAELQTIQKSKLLSVDPTVMTECPLWRYMLLPKLTGSLRDLNKGVLYT